ncbi:MAG: signal peptide peptidase SppA [Planctomycetes bacterium]|nr:signal peptide peptidase SppA [Planctomycetota bacterium]
MKRTSLLLIVLTALPLSYTATAVAQFGMFDFGDKDKTPKAKIAHFKIAGPLRETPSDMGGFPFMQMEQPSSLKGLLERLKKARSDNSVKAVVVELQKAQLGAGQLAEIRDALASFAAVDKDVFVHADSLSTGTYALATGASHISIVPTGDVWLVGLYGESPYLRAMFDKIGVFPDFEHCGDYKSAHEPFTQTGPSKESQEMTDWLLDGIYGSIVDMIADGRNMTAQKVRDLIDGGPYSAEAALEAGLIDSVQQRQDFIAKLETRFGSDTPIVTNYGKKDEFEVSENFFEAFQQLMQFFNNEEKEHTEPSVAIIYVEGAIQTGSPEQSLFGPAEGAFSTPIRKALDKAAKDESVKAVVLRVDSPGGSALASEIIWDATNRVAKRKPLIVSMGNVAASGGYYVACGADTIFADATTITGSIGVLGGKLVTTRGWEKLGINWSANQRGAMAGIFSSSTTFSDKERAKFVKYMNEIYETFKGRVVAGRGSKLTKKIDEMAGGRVYTGQQGLELGLVDRIGGLQDAIKFAAKEANLGDYEIRVIPEPPTIFDMFSPTKDKGYAHLAARFAPTLAGAEPFAAVLSTLSKVDPIKVRAILHTLRCAELIHKEGVVMMMPAEIVIR